jgi:hypothetical protein
VPIVTQWQRDLLEFALQHARGQGGKLFLPRTKFQQTLARACQRAGVPHTTPNDLRRTYSTWMRASGVPNELIAPTMGHIDTRMLDRVYARLPPAMLRVRLLQALGIQDARSAGAVDASRSDGRDGQIGQAGEALNPRKLAPRAGFEPATHGLTVLSFLRLKCRPDRVKIVRGQGGAVPAQYGRASPATRPNSSTAMRTTSSQIRICASMSAGFQP